MTFLIKIFVAAVLIFLHFKICFIDKEKIKAKHLLLLFVGIIISGILFAKLKDNYSKEFAEQYPLLSEDFKIYTIIIFLQAVGFLSLTIFQKVVKQPMEYITTSKSKKSSNNTRHKKTFKKEYNKLSNMQDFMFFIAISILILIFTFKPYFIS